MYKDGKVIGKRSTTNIHGGSTLLKQKDGTYLSLVHEKVLDRTPFAGTYMQRQARRNAYDKYIYLTYLAKHDENGVITSLSMPFRFGTKENIEFASGLVEYKDSLIMTLGIRDCKYAVVKIKKDKIMELFEK